MLYGRRNSNNCPIGATFFVNHEWTDYSLVNELYNQGFEIALHSVTHQSPQEYWAEATYDVMVEEFVDQKAQMAHFANISIDSLKGVRLPYLQINGDVTFQVMADYGLLYDFSMPTITYTDPGLWPYTLHYRSIQDCNVRPCPTSSIPGPWVIPMIAWWDLQNVPCAFVDMCYWVPDFEDEDAWFQFILTNFERHYKGNRTPFPFHVHEWFLDINPAVKNAFVRFLDLMNNLTDVFVVNSEEIIEWVKNPIPINEYKKKACKSFTSTTCNYVNCGPLFSYHNDVQYWMQICNKCPRVYPWLGNPLGQ